MADKTEIINRVVRDIGQINPTYPAAWDSAFIAPAAEAPRFYVRSFSHYHCVRDRVCDYQIGEFSDYKDAKLYCDFRNALLKLHGSDEYPHSLHFSVSAGLIFPQWQPKLSEEGNRSFP